MYLYVDRPLTSLDDGCRFLVWSMRAWVTSLAEQRCPAQILAPAFARWRMIGGLQPFHRAMLLFNRDALETFAFCPIACNHVSEHEAVILELVTSLRSRGVDQTRATLELVVQHEAIDDIMDALSQLAAALAVAGIYPDQPARTPGPNHHG